MNVNRYNYEEFFLLYVDNELTAAERVEVEDFVDANPDLQEELAVLKQLKLRPETGIQFEGKEMLMKAEQAEMINETNYEEFFLLYVDNELDPVLRRQVESFAAGKPSFRQELNLLLQTKVEPEHAVVFPDKSLLYREPEADRKPVIILWWRVVAVAAMLLLALGIFWLTNRKAANDENRVAGKTEQQQPGNKTTITPADQNTAGQPEEKVQPKDVAGDQQLANKQDKIITQPKIKTARDNDEPVQTHRNVANLNKRQEPVEVIDRAVITADLTNIASNTPDKNISTVLETARPNNVTAIGQTVSYTPDEPTTPYEENNKLYFANTSVNKKSKLRGFFRKVTRVIEKTANLPSLEEKGILIGNLEIALK
ncbi:MAG: hypothetical protein WCF67_13910 [Chitinophagaceae bacterium]